MTAQSLESRLRMTDIRSADDYLNAIRQYISDMNSQGHGLEAIGAGEVLRREERNLQFASGTEAHGYLGASITYAESTYTYNCRNKFHHTVHVTGSQNERFITITTSDPAMYSNSARLRIEVSIDLLREIVAIADEMAAKKKGKNGSF